MYTVHSWSAYSWFCESSRKRSELCIAISYKNIPGLFNKEYPPVAGEMTVN